MGDLYTSLADWQPLDEAKRLDIWLAVNIMGWHVYHGAWGPSWRYRDKEIAAVHPGLAENIWTGFWVFATSVRKADQRDDAHKIYRFENSEIKLSYVPGREWNPSSSRACLDLLKTRINSLGYDWEIIERSGLFTTTILEEDSIISMGTGDSECLVFCEVVRASIESIP